LDGIEKRGVSVFSSYCWKQENAQINLCNKQRI